LRDLEKMADRRAALEMFNHGVAARDDKELPQHLEQAYSLFSSACIVDPSFSTAWYNVGVANGDMGLVAAAVANYRRQLELPIGPEAGDLDLEYKAKGPATWGASCTVWVISTRPGPRLRKPYLSIRYRRNRSARYP
jgi:hypothetical protein